ncbi:hypothetical protein AOA59_24120 [Pseudomonas sp. 2822-15]|uniref:hypothetical protein n=1 Tax=Pseudomonas sp. 2822-15 TaxID=1712677 RepID=UPI000C158009|nr:hypothetical protein [Pseudomonas sp. 2822-15]PIB41823.1 hypothetical protein AOA59_24120 [Pseudomonas sp. 2822-15]
MMPPDAEELRRRTEEGKKNIEFRDLMDSINYDINDQTRSGQSSTVFVLGKNNAEFADAVLERFSESELSVEYDEDTTKLTISWELPEGEEE